MPDDARPPVPPRRSSTPAPAAPAPDPADLGTAFGMELTIGGPDAAGNAPGDAETDDAADDRPHDDDPLQWIRRWLDGPAPR